MRRHSAEAGGGSEGKGGAGLFAAGSLGEQREESPHPAQVQSLAREGLPRRPRALVGRRALHRPWSATHTSTSRTGTRALAHGDLGTEIQTAWFPPSPEVGPSESGLADSQPPVSCPQAYGHLPAERKQEGQMVGQGSQAMTGDSCDPGGITAVAEGRPQAVRCSPGPCAVCTVCRRAWLEVRTGALTGHMHSAHCPRISPPT